MSTSTIPDMISVRVAQFGNTTRTLKMPAGCTVFDCIKKAEFNAAGYEIRINDELVGLTTVVKHNESIVLMKPVAGN